MAYIGKQPVIGNFQKCDAISVVNGQAAYTLQVGGSNVSPQSENHMLVSLNGILQSPTDSFTVSGSTITFASALSTGDVIDFVMILGNVLDLGVPSDNTVTTAKISDSAITPAKLGYDYNQYRNIIINGDMSIAQRGTSETGISNTAGYFTCDRWRFLTSGTGTWTQSQSTDVPSGQGFANSIKLDCTTSNTQSSADYLMLNYNIEGQDLQYLKKGTANAESLTVSFWTKSNKTGTYTFELDDNDNGRSISKTYTVDSANTWEKKTITIEGDTTGTLDNDNNNSLRFYFWFSAGSNYTSGTLQTSWQSTTDANRVSSSNVYLGDSTNDEVYITGVQLEAGTTASDFEFLPYDVNLNRCLRYLPSIKVTTYSFGGHVMDSDSARKTFDLKVPARTAPTGISYDGTIKFTNAAGTGQGTGIAFYSATTDQLSIFSVGASAGNFTQGYSSSLNTDSNLTRTILCTGCEL